MAYAERTTVSYDKTILSLPLPEFTRRAEDLVDLRSKHHRRTWVSPFLLGSVRAGVHLFDYLTNLRRHLCKQQGNHLPVSGQSYLQFKVIHR